MKQRTEINRFLKILLRIQGGYFIVTGIWPLVHIHSFMQVTGPKTDIWLVKMVGLLAASTGTSLLIASRKNFPSTEIIFLALLSTLSFAAIDLYYVSTGTISKIYLSDAFEELLLVILFSISLSRQARTRNEMA